MCEEKYIECSESYKSMLGEVSLGSQKSGRSGRIEKFPFWDKVQDFAVTNEFQSSTTWPKEDPWNSKLRALQSCRHVMACTVVNFCWTRSLSITRFFDFEGHLIIVNNDRKKHFDLLTQYYLRTQLCIFSQTRLPYLKVEKSRRSKFLSIWFVTA